MINVAGQRKQTRGQRASIPISTSLWVHFPMPLPLFSGRPTFILPSRRCRPVRPPAGTARRTRPGRCTLPSRATCGARSGLWAWDARCRTSFAATTPTLSRKVRHWSPPACAPNSTCHKCTFAYRTLRGQLPGTVRCGAWRVLNAWWSQARCHDMLLLFLRPRGGQKAAITYAAYLLPPELSD